MLLTAVGLALLGVGCGSASSSSYLIAVQNGRRLVDAAAATDELRVLELISGIWRAAISLGMFVAPSVSGALFDAIGFRAQSLLAVGLQAVNVRRVKNFSISYLVSLIHVGVAFTCSML